MGTIDAVKQMQAEGKSQDEIIQILSRQGVSTKDITSAVSQSQIRDAVTAPPAEPVGDRAGGIQEPQLGGEKVGEVYGEESAMTAQAGMGGLSNAPGAQEIGEAPQPSMMNKPPSPGAGGVPPATQEYGEKSMGGDYAGMQPSMLGQEGSAQQGVYDQQMAPSPMPVGGTEESYPVPGSEGVIPQGGGAEPSAGGYDQYGAYPQYQSYQEAMSSDVISEIAEQVVSEKLSNLHDQLEKSVDLKTVFETKLSSLDERLKRIEHIIDRVQLSLLQKMGDYAADVGDVKKELEETQKSFKSLLPKSHRKHHSSHHGRGHPHP